MAQKIIYQSVARSLYVAPATIAVFSTFSQPPPINKVPAHQQPQVNFELVRGATEPPPWFVFSEFSQPRFGPVQPAQQPSPIFETARGPTETPQSLVFSEFSQPRFSTTVQPAEEPSPLLEVQKPPPQTLVFSTFSQPGFYKVPVKIEQQPDVDFRALRPDAAVSRFGFFPLFDQPRFATGLKPYLQDSVFFAVKLPPFTVTLTTTWNFSNFDAPQKAVPRGLFDDWADNQAITQSGFQPYVFSPFEQPFAQRITLADEQPGTLFETLPPQTAPFVGFSTFDLPQRAKAPLADGLAKTVTVVKYTQTPTTFQGFSQFVEVVLTKSIAYRHSESKSWNIKPPDVIPPTPPGASGGPKKKKPGQHTGLEPLVRRPEPPKPAAAKPLLPPAELVRHTPAPAPDTRDPFAHVDNRDMPDVLGLEQQIAAAEAESRQRRLDEQDIADVLALLNALD